MRRVRHGGEGLSTSVYRVQGAVVLELPGFGMGRATARRGRLAWGASIVARGNGKSISKYTSSA